MKKVSLFGFCIILIAPLYISAQINGKPIISVAEKEIREGSIRLRSVQLERIKRDASKTLKPETEEARKKRFVLIKKDFEKIQKLQNSIIKAYTTGKQISYEKINKKSKGLALTALRLDVNLFGANSGISFIIKSDRPENKESVRNLIILTDNALRSFVNSPIFKDLNTVDTKESQKTQIELRKVIYHSSKLSRLAGKIQ